jgi:hypothetical protein
MGPLPILPSAPTIAQGMHARVSLLGLPANLVWVDVGGLGSRVGVA